MIPSTAFNQKKLAVVLGAGASYDVWNEGTIESRDWRPPLTRELFRIDIRPTFAPILQYYPGAAALVQELGPLSADQSSFDLENKLREYADHSDPRVRRLYKEIPLYLRDVIAEARTHHVRWPGCYAQLVKGVLADEPHRVLFIVLNYDDFIEQALEPYDLGVTKLEDYVREDRQALVVKVHGSIDWFYSIPSNADNLFEAIRMLDISTPLRPFSLAPERRRGPLGHQRRPWLHPIMTAPLAGKGAMNMVCPDDHILAARQFLSDCGRLMVIGTSGKDDDVFELLASSMRRDTVAHFVGSKGVTNVAARFCGKLPRLHESRCTAYSQGFRLYLRDSSFRSFLQA
jgi:hypothetical protein